MSEDGFYVEVDLTKADAYVKRLPAGVKTTLMSRVLHRLGIVGESDMKKAITQVGARRFGIGIGSVSHRIQGSTVIIGPTARSDGGFPYMDAVNRGTGLHGPHHQMIRPKKPGGVLVWEDRSGEVHFAKYVQGMKPKEFVTPTYRMLNSHSQRHAEDEVVKFLQELGVAA